MISKVKLSILLQLSHGMNSVRSVFGDMPRAVVLDYCKNIYPYFCCRLKHIQWDVRTLTACVIVVEVCGRFYTAFPFTIFV